MNPLPIASPIDLGSSSSRPAKNWVSLALPLAVLILLCLSVGWVATKLNADFYATNQPFFDSIAYHGTTNRVMTATKEEGLLSALKIACYNQTVCLPFIIAAVAGILFEPSRQIGIWIQTGELMFLCLTLWYYFTSVRRMSPVTAGLATCPFLVLRCLYMNNGGISDFRMDLSLMLLFGASCVWYLTAASSRSRWTYVVFGISVAATCLFRGTAPVYLVLTLGPVILWDLAVLPRRRNHLIGLILATSIASVLSLWFYVLNFKHLHYYYFVWNTDANAKLPIREASKHLEYVWNHIGVPVVIYIVLFRCVCGWSRLKEANYAWRAAVKRLREDLAGFDLRPIWIGAMPVLFLVLRGAGLNPYVSMPSVIGICLFALSSSTPKRELRLGKPMVLCLLVGMCFCGMRVIRAGVKDHRGDSPHSMAAHQKTLDSILLDAKSHRLSVARYATTHLFFLCTHSLESVALWDRADAEFEKGKLRENGIELFADASLSIAAEADWKALSGDNEEEKLGRLVEGAGANIDYLIIPTADCAETLKERVAHNVINRYAPTIRERLLSTGIWEPISEEIRNRDDEIVQIFRNRNRFAPTTAVTNYRTEGP